MKYVFVLMVFVVGDNQWREWRSYSTVEACNEAVQTLRHHREDKIQAYCLARQVNE